MTPSEAVGSLQKMLFGAPNNSFSKQGKRKVSVLGKHVRV